MIERNSYVVAPEIPLLVLFVSKEATNAKISIDCSVGQIISARKTSKAEVISINVSGNSLT